ncbi:MAG TPA: hypothetical protein G4O04_01030 [Anaerolineae bacterium]|nr:hypothetical protein [Anaerolineae bacterium]HID84528.1 hypothetical protein [Anaerolineales bacterium]HIQ09302.1 hypothetical protein [Anaerolineaceae bacterium]
MDILGVGFPELVLLFVIILLVMGPEDMQKVARTMGRWLAQVHQSEVWRSLVQLRRETQRIFYQMEQEASLKDMREIERTLEKELRQAVVFNKPMDAGGATNEPPEGSTGEAAPSEQASSADGPEAPAAGEEQAPPPPEVVS